MAGEYITRLRDALRAWKFGYCPNLVFGSKLLRFPHRQTVFPAPYYNATMLPQLRAKLRSFWLLDHPDPKAKNSWPELWVEFAIELLITFYQFGAEQMNLPTNFWAGLLCWTIGLTIALRIFWILPFLSSWTRSAKASVIVLVVVLVISIATKPVAKAYEKYELSKNSSDVQPPQAAPTLEQLQTETYSHLTADIYLPPNGNIYSSDVTVKNGGSAVIQNKAIICYIHRLTASDGMQVFDAENVGEVIKPDGQWTLFTPGPGFDPTAYMDGIRIAGYGDGQTDSCIPAVRVSKLPVQCADVSVYIYYKIEQDPQQIASKEFRFVAKKTDDYLKWSQMAIGYRGSYCPALTPPAKTTSLLPTKKFSKKKLPASVNPNAPNYVLRPPEEPPQSANSARVPPQCAGNSTLYEGNVGPPPNDPCATYFRNGFTPGANGQNQITLRGKANFIANVLQGVNVDAGDEALLYDNFFASQPQPVSADEWKQRLDNTHAMLQKRWSTLTAEKQKGKEDQWSDFATQVQMQTINQEQIAIQLKALLDMSDSKQPSQ